MNTRTTFLLLGMVLTFLTTSSIARGDETIANVTITATKVRAGLVYNDWDIKATFDVIRAAPPAVTIYFRVYLEETDVINDEEFGPDFVCVPPASWVPRGDGRVQATVTANFKAVSDYYGTDWDIDGECVDEVSCKDAVGRLGGGVDTSHSGGYDYAYLVENDPYLVAMDPTAMITQVIIGGQSFNLNPPLARGQQTTIAFNHPNGPPRDDVNAESTIPYTLVFTNGMTDSGLTVGPGISAWSNYGAGWPGTNGIPSFTSSGNPVLCTNITLNLANSRGATTLAAMFIGFAQADLPTAYDGHLLLLPVTTILLNLPGTGLALPGQLPCDSSLSGLSVLLQALEVDAGASKGVSFTRGLRLLLGL